MLNEDVLGDETKVSITYKELYKDVEIGRIILINDGTIELKVKEIVDKDILCEIINSGFPVYAIITKGNWLEFDTEKDYEILLEASLNNKISDDLEVINA